VDEKTFAKEFPRFHLKEILDSGPDRLLTDDRARFRAATRKASPSGPRSVSREIIRPHQFCNISGLRVSLVNSAIPHMLRESGFYCVSFNVANVLPQW
jgi:hypothetical protein